MEELITSDLKVGIVAGGQLGKMMCMVANKWDINTSVLDPDDSCPASKVCTSYVKGNYKNYDDLLAFGKQVDMIVLEIEHVNTEALKELKSLGKKIIPDPDTLEIIQDKGLQKQFMVDHQIPTGEFKLFESGKDIAAAVNKGELEIPFVCKTRKFGYDGQGVFIVKDSSDLDTLPETPCLVETFVEIEKELAVIVARTKNGESSCFPTVEMTFLEGANLVDMLLCPADISKDIENRANEIALRLASAFELEGILAIEMFLKKDGTILINEVAPRAHNSGHHTIEGCYTSQYEQLLRVAFNLPLGSTHLIGNCAMLNVLGSEGFNGPPKYQGIKESMALEGVHIHIYGKNETRPFRKMGHVTIVHNDRQTVFKNSEVVKSNIKVIS